MILYFADFANFTEILCSNRSVKEQIFKYMLFASKVQQGVVMLCQFAVGLPTNTDDDVKDKYAC